MMFSASGGDTILSTLFTHKKICKSEASSKATKIDFNAYPIK